MDHKSEEGSSFWGTVMFLGVVACFAIYVIHLCQKIINESRADSILSGVVELAEREKERMDADGSSLEDERSIIGSMEHKGYSFTMVEGSTPALIKIETEKRAITHGVCAVLKKKLKKSTWRDAFQKVLIVDRMGDEKTDISIYDCPRDRIPALRFYVKFEVESTVEENTPEEKTSSETQLPPLPSTPKSVSSSSYTPTTRITSSRTTNTVSCPAGTSQNGAGGIATGGCRCNHSGESWNGKSCEMRCPEGSSKVASEEGDSTNVPGCHCNTETPVWTGKRCVRKCSGNKIFDIEKGTCVCPKNMHPKPDDPNVCIECNKTSDCLEGYKCVNNKCTGDDKEYDDCRWGICQTCNSDGSRSNISEPLPCEVAGLNGQCNRNGTCYPVEGEGRHCSAIRRCPTGEFCNYGGNFNSSKKQRGKFGQTPNVCQIVDPQEFTHGGVTYYYNTKKDLKSWCRAANNKPNCKWGYLAKPGAESWCASLGKRLLTQAEMVKVWDVLKRELPQTYTGYAYWTQEGVWLEDKQGRRSFGKGHSDGYGGKGGVVCR